MKINIKKIRKEAKQYIGLAAEWIKKAYLVLWHGIFAIWFKVGLAFFKHVHVYSDKETGTVHTVLFTNKSKIYKKEKTTTEQTPPITPVVQETKPEGQV